MPKLGIKITAAKFKSNNIARRTFTTFIDLVAPSVATPIDVEEIEIATTASFSSETPGTADQDILSNDHNAKGAAAAGRILKDRLTLRAIIASSPIESPAYRDLRKAPALNDINS